MSGILFNNPGKIAVGVLALFVTGLSIIGCASAGSANVPVTPPRHFEFEAKGEGASQSITITKYTGDNDAVRIPETINNIPVRSLARNSFRRTEIKTIIIPEGVTDIENYCFLVDPKNGSLVTITLPQSVKFIGFLAFDQKLEHSMAFINSGVSPYTMKIAIGANVELSNDRVPENISLITFDSFHFSFDDFYKQNGRKAGVYTIEKDAANWIYSPN
jgi:hypothetical protein